MILLLHNLFLILQHQIKLYITEVIVTKNGYSAFHCISTKKREAEKMELAEAKLIQRLLIAEEEERSGKVMDFDKVQAKIKAKYDL